MSLVGGLLVDVAGKVGATLVESVLGERFGKLGGDLTKTVVETIAGKAGVTPAALPELPPKELETAVKQTEAVMPELMTLWSRGLDGQFALLQAETKEGFWQSAWRWGWMYLLAIFWTFYVLVFPIMAALGLPVEQRVDVAILLTLTTWFISLYMGGHTVKALGESAIAAVASWRGK